MSKIIQFGIVMDVEGNVNADESLGTRITIKKFVTNEGLFPYVSSRAIRRGIRTAFADFNYKVDPYQTLANKNEGNGKQQFGDSGDVDTYIDQDLFGFLVTAKKNNTFSRKSPIEISYLVSMEPIPITVEFAGRFPINKNPIPYEVEEAKYIGRFFGNIYNYIGIFNESELSDEIRKKLKRKKLKVLDGEQNIFFLDMKKREARLKAFLEILLGGKWKFPRSSTQLNAGYYKYVVLVKGETVRPLEPFIRLNKINEKIVEVEEKKKAGKTVKVIREINNSMRTLDLNKLSELNGEVYVIDYVGDLKSEYKNIKIFKPNEVDKVINLLVKDFLVDPQSSNFVNRMWYYLTTGISNSKKRKSGKK